MALAKEIEDEGDPYAAEAPFDRAHKIQATTSTQPPRYHRTNQKGKALKLIQSLDGTQKKSPTVQPVIAKFESDPGYQAALKQIAVASRSAAAAKPAAAPIKICSRFLARIECSGGRGPAVQGGVGRLHSQDSSASSRSFSGDTA